MTHINNINLSDFSNWKTGVYDWKTGVYAGNNTARICLNDYTTATIGNSYTISLSDTKYHLLIRELDKNKKFLASYNLANGDKYIVAEGVTYLAISLYCYAGEGGKTFNTYKVLFNNGFKVSMVIQDKDEEEENTVVVDSKNNILSFSRYDLNKISTWKTGTFDEAKYAYTTNAHRICVNEDIPCDNGKFYKFNISDNNYKIIIREMMDSYRITTYTLTNGQTYRPSSNMTSIRISLCGVNEQNKTYATYEALFKNGVSIWFDTVNPEVVQAPNLKEEIRQMYLTGDCRLHNISRYNVNFVAMNKLYTELYNEDEELRFVEDCGQNFFASTTRNSKGILQTMYIHGINEDFNKILQKCKESRDEICQFVYDNPEMTELDKILYIHEDLAKRTTYTLSESSISQNIWNLLANGRSVCAGYAATSRCLLNRIGVDAVEVIGNSMNHAWNLVKVNGNWYQYDVTWDDRDRKSNLDVVHTYLLRTDAEWISTTALPGKHWGWFVGSQKSDQSGYKATDKSFMNWFVHDIKNFMTYYDGYWYYASNDNKSIMKCKLDGSVNEVIKTFDTTIVIQSVENGVLTCSSGSTVNTIQLEWKGLDYNTFIANIGLTASDRTKALYDDYVDCYNSQQK